MLYCPRNILVCPVQFPVYPWSYLRLDIYRISLDHNWLLVYSWFPIPFQGYPWSYLDIYRISPNNTCWVRDIPNQFRDILGYKWVDSQALSGVSLVEGLFHRDIYSTFLNYACFVCWYFVYVVAGLRSKRRKMSPPPIEQPEDYWVQPEP